MLKALIGFLLGISVFGLLNIPAMAGQSSQPSLVGFGSSASQQYQVSIARTNYTTENSGGIKLRKSVYRVHLQITTLEDGTLPVPATGQFTSLAMNQTIDGWSGNSDINNSEQSMKDEVRIHRGQTILMVGKTNFPLGNNSEKASIYAQVRNSTVGPKAKSTKTSNVASVAQVVSAKTKPPSNIKPEMRKVKIQRTLNSVIESSNQSNNDNLPIRLKWLVVGILLGITAWLFINTFKVRVHEQNSPDHPVHSSPKSRSLFANYPPFQRLGNAIEEWRNGIGIFIDFAMLENKKIRDSEDSSTSEERLNKMTRWSAGIGLIFGWSTMFLISRLSMNLFSWIQIQDPFNRLGFVFSVAVLIGTCCYNVACLQPRRNGGLVRICLGITSGIIIGMATMAWYAMKYGVSVS